ncbi:hypothetical protein ACFSHP_08675 [Novosphingobium panipatense]
MIDCRKLVDPQARLACFDTNAAAVDAAEANKEIVLFDRQAVSKARKTLFGLTLPTFDMFGDKSEGAKEEEEGFSSIESVVKGCSVTAMASMSSLLRTAPSGCRSSASSSFRIQPPGRRSG